MIENKLIAQRERGKKAEQIMKAEIVQEAFERLQETIDSGWKKSDASDQDGRHNAYLMNRLLINFKRGFEQAMATGKSAEKQLLDIQDKSKLRKWANV